MRMFCGGLVLGIGVVLALAEPAHACSYSGPFDTYGRSSAAPGELWWLVGAPEGDDGQLVTEMTLEAADGGRDLVVEVAAIGLIRTYALRVPEDAEPGRELHYPLYASAAGPSDDRILRVVDETTPALDEDIPLPDVELRMVYSRVGYAGIATASMFYPCTKAPGLWYHQYDERPRLIGAVPPGYVLDVTVRPPGEPPYSDFNAANDIVFEGHRPGAVGLYLAPAQEGEVLTVHTRLRRVYDGAAGPTRTFDVDPVDGTVDERVEWVGCGAAGGRAPPAVVALLVVLLARRRRSGRARS